MTEYTERPSPVTLWRERNRAAGYSRSWLDTIPPSAVAAVLILAERGPLTGARVAALTTGSQANMTARTLPRLARLGFVTGRPGESEHRSARTPIVWGLTTLGRDLARGIINGTEK